MAEYHRKIELQSPDDLQYLISNVRRAAHDKIDKDLPPIEGEDKMRRRVEELVQEYIVKVFQTTCENISINGLAPSPALISSSFANSASTNATSIEEHEPLNSKLFSRAKDLARQEEDLVEEIAALRRTMPAVTVEEARGAYKKGMEADEDRLARELERIQAEEGTQRADLRVRELERQEAVEGSWDKGVRGLEKLKRAMPETVAKKERAARAEQYVLQPERR